MKIINMKRGKKHKILRHALLFALCFALMVPILMYPVSICAKAEETDDYGYEKLYDDSYHPDENLDKYIWIQIHTYNSDKSVNVRRVALYMRIGEKIPVDKLNLPTERELVKPSNDSTFLGWYIRRIDRSQGDDSRFFHKDNLAYRDNLSRSDPSGNSGLIDDRDKEYKLNDFTLDYSNFAL